MTSALQSVGQSSFSTQIESEAATDSTLSYHFWKYEDGVVILLLEGSTSSVFLLQVLKYYNETLPSDP
jgi:hypothetical protein